MSSSKLEKETAEIRTIINPRAIVTKTVSGNKKNRNTAGKIYLSAKWIGKEVLVILK